MLTSILQVILLIFIVLMIFNVIIFVHELGHFLAAKWRGLQVDRFQIWFGRPIWKKTIGGVQYGLGWIPAGGFVALPQMAPMESIEGSNEQRAPLPPISAMDKIIVAFAGPLFSMLLALIAAVAVWKVGKPADFIPTTVVGFVEPDSPAAAAGILVGDRILAINGKPVDGFAGSLDSITEQIILSRGEKLRVQIQRESMPKPLEIATGFEREESKWFQRSGLRQIGISASRPAVIGAVVENSPAEKAGLKPNDEIVAVDGSPLLSVEQLSYLLKKGDWKAVQLSIKDPQGAVREVLVAPKKPITPKDSEPRIGIVWDFSRDADTTIVHPKPFKQVADSLEMMWVTITGVSSPTSGLGVDHLSGPVGIAKLIYQLLQTEDGWRRILAFMVLFNVNLAVLNMLPFPVLDGGHITLAILEKIARRPVQARPLEVIQTACALALISLMLYITSKDIGDGFGRGGSGSSNKMIFEPN
ncbi:MAG: RIP metalloprotease RseP [Verrucomicrobia bacterium]|nr:MAG: RIP metalloprotease RseP [Verrucomicrobiota bacterium]